MPLNDTPQSKDDLAFWLTTLTGTRIGDYILGDYVGSGRIGHVYRARHAEIDDIEHAVKLMPDLRPGWETEIRKVTKLSTVPSVVHFHNLGKEKIVSGNRSATVLYTVWDYIHPGRNLTSILRDPNYVPASFVLAVVETILRVLYACHRRGIARHGDLHAGNILIGEHDGGILGPDLQPVEPIYVSDFGYGASQCGPKPKDDYHGLALITDALVKKVDWATANSSDKQLLRGMRTILKKVLSEGTSSERTSPKDILEALSTVRNHAGLVGENGWQASLTTTGQELKGFSVGSYQVSEMLGDNWPLWRSLFVPTVPAKSRILERDITSVVTGPRGCGKTMLFRRLSERLIVECGPVDDTTATFAGIYVNSNDVADAFASFPASPDQDSAEKLFCYTHLCFLSDFLAVEAVHARVRGLRTTPRLIHLLAEWLGRPTHAASLIADEDPLERYRSLLEEIKNSFVASDCVANFPSKLDFSHHAWLKRMVPELRSACPWIGDRIVLFFIDDYTTPRVSSGMQKALNRILFQRSHEFVFKIATEAATTFCPEDLTGKQLQDGDDYRFVDLGEEALFMNDDERIAFLDEVFRKRLSSDQRVSGKVASLKGLLGSLGRSKTAFARLLRSDETEEVEPRKIKLLRGATRRRALYHGHDVFCSLWSGDTRIMIQLMQELVDTGATSSTPPLADSIPDEDQDRVFRNRGSQWLDMQTRNQPSNIKKFNRLLRREKENDSQFQLVGGSYGGHLKAIVESFKDAARLELLGAVYSITDNGRTREVPKMAFRIEITDDFRLTPLATEIYRDLIRYGLFMRDARGKSIRGAMVPRLYLRRLLLPYCVLALSKRDSVAMSCEWFRKLLLSPDKFTDAWKRHRQPSLATSPDQGLLNFDGPGMVVLPESQYDDIGLEEDGVE